MANGSTTTPVAIFSGETSLGGEAPLDGLITIQDVIAAGGGMQYIQRVPQAGSNGGILCFAISLWKIRPPMCWHFRRKGQASSRLSEASRLIMWGRRILRILRWRCFR